MEEPAPEDPRPLSPRPSNVEPRKLATKLSMIQVPKAEPEVQNAIALSTKNGKYHPHDVSGGQHGNGHWLQAKRPMPIDMLSNLEALGGPRERAPLIYDGDPQRSLSKLHEDVVSSYRMLCHSLGEAERTDLTDPSPYAGGSLLSLPMANLGVRPSTFPSSNNSLLRGFPSHGRRAIGAPPSFAQPAVQYSAALDELRGYGSNLGGAPHPLGGIDQYNNAGSSNMSRAVPFGGPGGYGYNPYSNGVPGMPDILGARSQGAQQQYIPGYANSLIPAISKPGGIRVSSISTYDQDNLEGGLRGESQLLFPPVGSTFEGQPVRGGGGMARGPGIDSMADLKYRKRAPLSVDVLDSDFVAQPHAHYKSERDQLDSFLADYVEAGIKPQLPSKSPMLRAQRGGDFY